MFTEVAVSSDLRERTRTPAKVESTLPLPELMPREQAAAGDEKIKGGGVATLQGHTILWRIQNRTLTLELADLNGTSDGPQVLSFLAPGPILPYCCLVTEVDSGNFAVDLITKQGFLYTIALPFAVFSEWSPSAEWRSVKSPFGVDTVVPLGLVAKSPLHLVAALADGTIASLKRPSLLSEFEVTVFSDPKEPGIFQLWSRPDAVPGHSGLSKRAAVDLCVFADKVISLSVSGSLRVWSSDTLELISQEPSLEASKYITSPSNYLKVHGSALVVCMDNEFRVYNERLQVVQVFAIPADVQGWYVADFLMENQSIIAAFKAHESSQIWCLEAAGESYLISDMLPTISSLPDARELQNFVENIFSVKHYSSATLRRALATFDQAREEDVADFTVHAPPASTLSLKDAITKAVKRRVIDQKSSYRLEWIKFDSLCQEYEGAQSEVLAVGKSCDGIIWSIRSSFYTLLCPVSKVQRALAQNDPSSGLTSQINSLYNVFEPNALVQFEQELQAIVINSRKWGSQLLGAQIASLYESLIKPHVDEQGILKIRSKLVNFQDVDAQLCEILNACLIKDPSSDSAHDTLTPLGCSALATVALGHAENSLKFVSKVLLFTLFAYGEGVTKSHTDTFAAGLGHLRTSAAIISLQAPLDSESRRFNSCASAMQISVSHLHLKVVDFDSLVARLWHRLDFTDSHNLGVLLNLIRENWYPSSLLNATEYLGDDPESQFIYGLAKLNSPEQELIGTGMLVRLAPAMASTNSNMEINGLGQGVPSYFSALGDLCCEIGASPDCALKFYKLAARHGDSRDAYEKLLQLSIYQNNGLLAYEAVVGLAKHKDPNLRTHLEKFLDSQVSQNSVEFICKQLVFAGLSELVLDIMSSREVLGGLPAFKLNYAWCINLRDYLGAAKVMYQQAVKRSEPSFLVVALNALRLVDKEARWIVVDKEIVTESEIEAQLAQKMPSM